MSLASEVLSTISSTLAWENFSRQTWVLSEIFHTFCLSPSSMSFFTLRKHTCFLFILFLLVPPISFLPSPPSLARQAASPTVGNVNGLSLLGVVAPSLALQANLRLPLRWGQHTRSLQQSVGAKNRTMWKDDDSFRLGLGGLYRPLHAEHSRAQQSREQAAQPRQSVLDSALFWIHKDLTYASNRLLSPRCWSMLCRDWRQGPAVYCWGCVLVCARHRDVHFICVCVFCGAREGERKRQQPTVLLPASLPICLCSVCLHGTDSAV